MLISFLFFLSLFAAVGISSYRKSRGTKSDYYLASHDVSPMLVGLSAVATNNSGYMFIGVIGYTYVTGLASIWLMVGWILGDFLGSLWIHRNLRQAAKRSGESSYAGVLACWQGTRFGAWQRLAGILSLLFLLAYASAQLVAGSKALYVVLDLPIWSGAVIGGVIVAAYCLAGGIRASIWTDVAQSLVMVLAMATLLVVATQSVGGVGAAWSAMGQVPGFLNWYPSDLLIPGIGGAALFVMSWVFAGISVVGQPHVMVRFMALDDVGNMVRARCWYYLWFILFYGMATGVGMLSRILLSESGAFDAELALPMMAMELLSPVLVGLILAGIFAATMSTADSLVLSCSAALTHDLLPERTESTRILKLATVAITSLAVAWALLNEQSVFSLVVMSWSALASAFAPLLMVLAAGGRPSQKLAIIMSLLGLATALGWRWLGWHAHIYEGMPGILMGLVVYGVGQLLARATVTRTVNA
ncbi:sodium/proline symporter [Microbulbifer agarilyticus]|uniref:Sodium/proline symporter n=1 Tax=Microbulbifer agarilyticus TaxID=260552 RepID=A0A1Q2M272_9GAMM|nr:sodium/proline symporter [Microbulbifer agarilyticus]AQQ66766.1 sodium:proline symporter [Microbulbifer agarilyticus]MBY6210323.1 sodium/proline symporter [Microbulbifer agarilyticus]